MAPTLAALLSAPGLGIRVVAGTGTPADRAERLRRPVTWVAVSELADPTPYLEGGELVMLTGLGVDLDDGAAAYVRRLVRADVAALGLGVGVVHAEMPPALAAAADAAGLPLLEIDRPTPFIAVGKALADLMALEQSDRTRRRLDAMRALTARLARGGDGAPVPHAALRLLAELVDGWVAVLDARGRTRALEGRGARPDVARRLADQLRDRAGRTGRGGHTSAAHADSLGRVTVLPLGLRERPHGYLAVGAGPGVDLDHHLVAFAASVLTLDSEHARGSRPARHWARAAALAARCGLEPPPPPDAVLGPLAGDQPVRVLVARRPLDDVLAGLDDEEAVLGLPLADGSCLAVVADADVDEALAAVGPVPGGLSAPFVAGADSGGRDGAGPAGAGRDGAGRDGAGRDGGPDAGLRAAVDEARSLAARARDGVLRSGAAPPSLLELLGADAAAAFAQTVLAPLRAAEDGPVLVAALGAYLEAHGALAAAATALGVHRHTLRARLRRVGTLLGRDLDDVSTRAELWVALAVATRDLPRVRTTRPV